MKLYDYMREHYKYNKVENIDIVDDHPSFTPVNQLAVTLPAGLYMVRIAILWNLDTTTKSGIARFTYDGGTTWYEVWSEPKDRTNDNSGDFTYTIDHPGGVLDVQLEMARESGTASMECKNSEISAMRVG